MGLQRVDFGGHNSDNSSPPPRAQGGEQRRKKGGGKGIGGPRPSSCVGPSRLGRFWGSEPPGGQGPMFPFQSGPPAGASALLILLITVVWGLGHRGGRVSRSTFGPCWCHCLKPCTLLPVEPQGPLLAFPILGTRAVLPSGEVWVPLGVSSHWSLGHSAGPEPCLPSCSVCCAS